ncbi:hypothetical protein HK098_004465 [Nowakowskiella sp. JEL0407]|nr:hypothetical protein HK098_004465 [Nowakowskiella sp. JEL0407]
MPNESPPSSVPDDSFPFRPQFSTNNLPPHLFGSPTYISPLSSVDERRTHRLDSSLSLSNPLIRITMPTSTSSPISRTNPEIMVGKLLHQKNKSVAIAPSRASSDDPTEMLDILRQRRKPRTGGGMEDKLLKLAKESEKNEKMREFLKEWAKDGGEIEEVLATSNTEGITVMATLANIPRSRKRSSVAPDTRPSPGSLELNPSDTIPMKTLNKKKSTDDNEKQDPLSIAIPPPSAQFDTKNGANHRIPHRLEFTVYPQQQGNSPHQHLRIANFNDDKPLPKVPIVIRNRSKISLVLSDDMEAGFDDEVVEYIYHDDDMSIENYEEYMGPNESTEELSLDSSQNSQHKSGNKSENSDKEKRWKNYFEPVFRTLIFIVHPCTSPRNNL